MLRRTEGKKGAGEGQEGKVWKWSSGRGSSRNSGPHSTPPGPGVCRAEEECIGTSPLSLPSRVSLAKMVRQELQAPLALL